MAVDPPTDVTPTGQPSRRTDSGEHSAADKAEVRIRFSWSGIARASKYIGPTLLALGSLVAGRVQHSDAKAGADKAAKSADVAYKTLAPAANESAAEIKQLRLDLAALADTVRLHGKLLLSAQPGFTPAGAATGDVSHPGRRRRPDAALVKKVEEATTAKLPAIQARAAKAPTVPAVPAEIPAAAPAPSPARQQGVGGSNP